MTIPPDIKLGLTVFGDVMCKALSERRTTIPLAVVVALKAIGQLNSTEGLFLGVFVITTRIVTIAFQEICIEARALLEEQE